MSSETLEELRKEIDTLDDSILELLNRRVACALRIAKLKNEQSLPLKDIRREDDLLAELIASNQGPLESESVSRIFRAILDESIRLMHLGKSR